MKAPFLKRWRLRLVVVALLAAAGAAWWLTRKPPAPPVPPSGVVALADITQTVQAAGVLRPILHLGLPDVFIEHGDPAKLLALQGLDAAGIEQSIIKRFGDQIDAPRPALKVVG